MDKNYFEELNSINVSNKTEKKNGLTYLSWAYAWGELKKRHPLANCKVYEREDGRIYWDDGRTAWVKVSVTVENIEHIEYLPIMDNRNKSIPIENITSFDVNTAIQRALTKAIGRHGLGLYIYAGEDLPANENGEFPQKEEQPKPEQPRTQEFVQMSVAQRETIEKLLKEKDIVPNRAFADVGITDTKRVSKQQASKLIEYLIKCPNKKQSYTTEEISKSITDMEDVRIEPKVEQNDDDDLPFPM